MLRIVLREQLALARVPYQPSFTPIPHYSFSWYCESPSEQRVSKWSYFIHPVRVRKMCRTKNVPMMQELVDILQPLSQDLEDEDFLFTESSLKSRPIPTGLLHEYFKKVVKTDHTPYDLRHTNASILIHSGVNIIEVANRLGHSIPVCQKVYLHLFADAADVDTSKEEEFLAKTRSKPNLKAV